MNRDRIQIIKTIHKEQSGKYILYWMQNAQRIHYNHALNYAIELANQKGIPLIVWFNILPSYPEANLRHYTFMLEGILEVQAGLEELGITFEISFGDITQTIVSYLNDMDTLIVDKGYLKPQIQMRQVVYKLIDDSYLIDIIQIETDQLIPVASLYPKSAYGAYVIRPKVMQKMYSYMDYKPLPILRNQKNYMLDKALI